MGASFIFLPNQCNVSITFKFRILLQENDLPVPRRIIVWVGWKRISIIISWCRINIHTFLKGLGKLLIFLKMRFSISIFFWVSISIIIQQSNKKTKLELPITNERKHQVPSLLLKAYLILHSTGTNVYNTQHRKEKI